MLGLRGLEADDRHGHQLGLVIQHDSVHWADVLDAVAVSAPIIEQLGHPLAECARSGRCGVCAAVRALSRLRARWMQTGPGAEDLGRVEVSGNTVGASRSVPAVTRRLLLVSGWPDRLTSEAGRRAARASGQAGRLAAGEHPGSGPRPPDPHPGASPWSPGVEQDGTSRSRGGRLAPPVLYTRWVPGQRLRRVPDVSYAIPRLQLPGPTQSWPAPAVGPDGRPWFGEHRVTRPWPTWERRSGAAPSCAPKKSVFTLGL